MLTITSPMQFLYTLSIQQNNKIKVTQQELEQQLNIFSFPVEILIDITIAKLSMDIFCDREVHQTCLPQLTLKSSICSSSA
jgi:hypothetical protein